MSAHYDYRERGHVRCRHGWTDDTGHCERCSPSRPSCSACGAEVDDDELLCEACCDLGVREPEPEEEATP